MIKTHDVRVRVTKYQYDRIKNNARAKGFVTYVKKSPFRIEWDTKFYFYNISEANKKIYNILQK